MEIGEKAVTSCWDNRKEGLGWRESRERGDKSNQLTNGFYAETCRHEEATTLENIRKALDALEQKSWPFSLALLAQLPQEVVVPGIILRSVAMDIVSHGWDTSNYIRVRNCRNRGPHRRSFRHCRNSSRAVSVLVGLIVGVSTHSLLLLLLLHLFVVRVTVFVFRAGDSSSVGRCNHRHRGHGRWGCDIISLRTDHLVVAVVL